MAITRSTGALIGTSESSGVTLTNNSTVYTSSGSVTTDIDLLANNTSVADIWLYLVYTSGATIGTIDITINSHRLTGQGYNKTKPDFQIACVAATGNVVPLGKRPCSRFMAANILNNATGASLTNLSLLYELETLS